MALIVAFILFEYAQRIEEGEEIRKPIYYRNTKNKKEPKRRPSTSPTRKAYSDSEEDDPERRPPLSPTGKSPTAFC